MQWLSDLVAYLLRDGLGLDMNSRSVESVHFFIYDVIKIFTLLSVLIYSTSYVQSYFPPERTRRILGQRTGLGANTLAALLGTLTPFCSCSSIPLFIGFTGAGLPLSIRPGGATQPVARRARKQWRELLNHTTRFGRTAQAPERLVYLEACPVNESNGIRNAFAMAPKVWASPINNVRATISCSL